MVSDTSDENGEFIAAYGTQTGLDYCRTCAEDWPCTTVAAITQALEGVTP